MPTARRTESRNREADEYYTVAEAAEKARISYFVMYRLVRQGKVPSRRFGRSIRIPISFFRPDAGTTEAAEVAA